MKKVLVDTSIWISYFKDERAYRKLDALIQDNQICSNNLVLAELIPFLHIRNQAQVIESLLALPIVPLTINWELVINLQIENLKNGINNVGIPDLIMVDNVASNGLVLFSEDRHFRLMQKHFNFDLLELN